MKQIYHFDLAKPPVLNEKTLRVKLEWRKARRRTVLLALAGILLNICLAITAVALYPVNAFLSTACLFYACVAMYGGGAIAVIFTNVRRKCICQM